MQADGTAGTGLQKWTDVPLQTQVNGQAQATILGPQRQSSSLQTGLQGAQLSYSLIGQPRIFALMEGHHPLPNSEMHLDFGKYQ